MQPRRLIAERTIVGMPYSAALYTPPYPYPLYTFRLGQDPRSLIARNPQAARCGTTATTSYSDVSAMFKPPGVTTMASVVAAKAAAAAAGASGGGSFVHVHRATSSGEGLLPSSLDDLFAFSPRDGEVVPGSAERVARPTGDTRTSADSVAFQLDGPVTGRPSRASESGLADLATHGLDTITMPAIRTPAPSDVPNVVVTTVDGQPLSSKNPFDLPSPEVALAGKQLPLLSAADGEALQALAGKPSDETVGSFASTNPFDSFQGFPAPVAASTGATFDPFSPETSVHAVEHAVATVAVGSSAQHIPQPPAPYVSMGTPVVTSPSNSTDIPPPFAEQMPAVVSATPTEMPAVMPAAHQPMMVMPTQAVPVPLGPGTATPYGMVPNMLYTAPMLQPGGQIPDMATAAAMGLPLGMGMMPPMITPITMQQVQMQQQMQQQVQMQHYLQQLQLQQMAAAASATPGMMMVMGPGGPTMMVGASPAMVPVPTAAYPPQIQVPQAQSTGTTPQATPVMPGAAVGSVSVATTPSVLPAVPPLAPATHTSTPVSAPSTTPAPAPGVPSIPATGSVATSAPAVSPAVGGGGGVWTEDVFGQPTSNPTPVMPGIGARRPLPQVPDDPFANSTSFPTYADS